MGGCQIVLIMQHKFTLKLKVGHSTTNPFTSLSMQSSTLSHLHELLVDVKDASGKFVRTMAR